MDGQTPWAPIAMVLAIAWFLVSFAFVFFPLYRRSAFRHVFASIILLLLIVAVNGSVYKGMLPAGATPNPSAQPAATVTCDLGTPITGRLFVEGSEINFRTGPGTTYALVINKRATRVLGTTEYRTLSSALVLQALCETDEWIKASIVEADGSPVDWETGWVKKEFVTKTPSAERQAGLLWDVEQETDFSAEEISLMKVGALKVLRDEPNCDTIVTGYRSESKGGYYVTCVSKSGGLDFNVWFTRADLEAGRKLGVPTAYPLEDSRRICEQAIKTSVTHPSTLDIHSIMGFATEVHDNGNRTVIQEFTAKNGFGLEITSRARCLIGPDGSLEISIDEVG